VGALFVFGAGKHRLYASQQMALALGEGQNVRNACPKREKRMGLENDLCVWYTKSGRKSNALPWNHKMDNSEQRGM